MSVYLSIYLSIYIHHTRSPPPPHHATPRTPSLPQDGWTPIYVAAYWGKTDAVKELIAAGCDINRATKVKQMTGLAFELACLCCRARVA
jgi:hypothetical protein